MRWWRNARISLKITLIFLPVVLVIAANGVNTLLNFGELRANLQVTTDARLEAVLALNDFVAVLGASQQRYLLLANQNEPGIRLDDPAQDVLASQDQMADALQRYQAARALEPGGQPDSELETYRALSDAYARYNVDNPTIAEAFRIYNDLSGLASALADQSEALIRESLAETSSALGAEQQSALLLTVMVVVLAMGLGLVASRSLSRPAQILQDLMEQISKGDGDLSRRIETVGRRDELGMVAEGFNRFSQSVESIVGLTRESLTELTGVGERLSQTMGQVSTAVTQIVGNLDRISGESGRQELAVEETSGAVNRIADSIDGLRARVEDQAAAVTQSSAAIEEMVASIRTVTDNLGYVESQLGELRGAADVGNTKLGSVTEQVHSVARRSDQLKEANELIASLASQTNLLAMNAAIEAAHAGEYGRGFAVVADEIRKLAETTNEQSREIDASLSDILAAIDAVVGASDEARDSFGHVLSRIEHVNQLNAEVTSAMREQSTGSQQILEAISTISQTTQRVDDDSAGIAESAGTIRTRAQALAELSQSLRIGMQEISEVTRDISGSVGAVRELSAENSACIQQVCDAVGRFRITGDSADEEGNPQPATELYNPGETAPAALQRHATAPSPADRRRLEVTPPPGAAVPDPDDVGGAD